MEWWLAEAVGWVMYCTLTLLLGGADLVLTVNFLDSVCCDNVTYKPVAFLQDMLVTQSRPAELEDNLNNIPLNLF